MVPLMGCVLSEPLSYISCLFKVCSFLSEVAIQIPHMEPAEQHSTGYQRWGEVLWSNSTRSLLFHYPTLLGSESYSPPSRVVSPTT